MEVGDATARTCGVCGVVFAATYKQRWNQKRHGTTPYCSGVCRGEASRRAMAVHDPAGAVKGSRGPVRGPCRRCGEMYRSYGAKAFCSVACYTASDQFRRMVVSNYEAVNARRRAEAAADPAAKTVTLACVNCGGEFVTPFKLRRRRYCSGACRRKWFAARYDRWVADPRSLTLPQCYDEFLNADELPCLVDGCDWVGKHLSAHANFAHGVTADQLRELAGFNKKTGLVSMDVHEALSARAQQWAPESLPANNPARPTPVGGRALRAEGREHLAKAAAERSLMAAAGVVSDRPAVPCRHCSAPVPQPLAGRRLYCSTECRSAWYGRAQHRLTCGRCGTGFAGTGDQRRENARGRAVYCSTLCRNTANAAYRTRRAGAAGD